MANPLLKLHLTTALAALALLAPGAAPATAKPELPPYYYGVSIQGPEGPQSEYELMRRGGVRSVHFGVGWPAVEPSPGQYDFARLDSIVAKTASQHLEAFPSINGTPSWVDPDPLRLPVQNSFQKAAWERFLTVLVDRYGPRGNFWSLRPDLPKVPITAWQIWNEPNFFYFASPRSPTQYAELVRISDRAIARADQRSKVILAGLFAHPKQRPPQAWQARGFLDRFYRVKGIKRHFDGVALHPYAADADELPRDINQIRKVMRRHGDARTSLWLTELGWGDGTDTAFEKGPRGQVRELKQALRILRNNQRRWRLTHIYWYAWKDLSGTCNFCDSVGLLRENGRPKRAWREFVKFSGCFGRFGTVIGTARRDRLVGTRRRDVIVGDGGHDRIIGRGGNDFVCAGPGKDRVTVGNGRDRVDGHWGNDRIYLRRGRDDAWGGAGADLIAGSFGADKLFGERGRDRLLGAAGNDRLFGGPGRDVLIGAKGKDRLRGGRGRDRLIPGAGRDNVRQ
jgi:hypothetical protein